MCAMGVKDAQASLNSETYHFACNAIIERQVYNKGSLAQSGSATGF